MDGVGRIPRDGFNKFHNYKYVTESAVMEHVRKGMAEKHVFLLPSVQTCEQITNEITRVCIEFRFLDGDTGEEISFRGYGDGHDKLDKGVYKAITGAVKYALMKTFLISSGDDPEQDAPPQQRKETPKPQPTPTPKAEPVTKTQLSEILSASKLIGEPTEKLTQRIKDMFGKTSAQMTQNDVFTLLEHYVKMAQKLPEYKWVDRLYFELCIKVGALPWATALEIKKQFGINGQDLNKIMENHMKDTDSFSTFIAELYAR